MWPVTLMASDFQGPHLKGVLPAVTWAGAAPLRCHRASVRALLACGCRGRQQAASHGHGVSSRAPGSVVGESMTPAPLPGQRRLTRSGIRYDSSCPRVHLSV